MEPVAVAKARSLARYAAGCSKGSIELTLSNREAWEFLRWYGASLGDNPSFQLEYASARRLHNPWPLLDGMQLMGFAIARLH